MIRNRTAQRRILIAASSSHHPCCGGIARYAREQDWHVAFEVIGAAAAPSGCQADGVIAVLEHDEQLELLPRYHHAPFVVVNLLGSDVTGASVGTDEAALGRLAADYFLERSFRSFAWAPLRAVNPPRTRFAAFAARHQEFGATCVMLSTAPLAAATPTPSEWLSRQTDLVRELQLLPHPAAVFAENDFVAAEVLDACRHAGLSVPEDIAVLGVGNDATLCDAASTPLSSVELQYDEIGYRAASLLGDTLFGESPGENSILLPPKGIVSRTSTEGPSVKDRRVAHAIHYIEENFSNPHLGVTDVASALGMSRRHLERSFRSETGLSIHEYLIKTRMHEASRLLRTHSRAKVRDVARLVGLDGEATFFRTFRRYFGKSPNQYRLCPTAPSAVTSPVALSV